MTRPAHNDKENQLKVYETNVEDGKTVPFYSKVSGKSRHRTFVQIIGSGVMMYYAWLRGLSRLVSLAGSILPCTRNIIATK